MPTPSAPRHPQTRAELTRRIKDRAHGLGFDFCRAIPLEDAPHADFFAAWLEQGRTGEMAYLARHLAKRRTPARLAETGPPFRSMLVLGVNYYQFALPPALRDDPSRGLIASYAWGDDYHEIIRPLLYTLDAFICEQTGRETQGKCLVDTGPVLERDWAQRAGLGFTGKNCCTITPGTGSWIFLAVILVPEILAYDPPPKPLTHAHPSPAFEQTIAGLPPARDYGAWEIPLTESSQGSSRRETTRTGTCGSCTRCLTACPTAAFTGPFHLDPLRCISYWTIEARSAIPRTLRSRFGNRIFGCDICQEVCPWNQRLPERRPVLSGLHAQVGRIALPLLEGFAAATPYWLEAGTFAARFRRSPVRRAKRTGMLRNVCVALGNWGDPVAVPALTRALHDAEPLPRQHAAWALGRILRGHSLEAARLALLQAQSTEADNAVREEIALALGAQSPG